MNISSEIRSWNIYSFEFWSHAREVSIFLWVDFFHFQIKLLLPKLNSTGQPTNTLSPPAILSESAILHSLMQFCFNPLKTWVPISFCCIYSLNQIKLALNLRRRKNNRIWIAFSWLWRRWSRLGQEERHAREEQWKGVPKMSVPSLKRI